MNNKPLAFIRPLIFVFTFIMAFSITGKSWLEKNGVDQLVLIGGNLLLFVVSLTAFFITFKALKSANPQAFVRAMYGSFMIKFFLIVVAAFIYIMIAKKEVNKPALIICGGLYIIYTAIETRALMKLLKQKKNA